MDTMKTRRAVRLLIASWLPLAALYAQAPPPLISPEVHPDGKVTFRFNAPNAQKVELRREGAAPVAMQKG
jgi:hypothetical protein